MKSSNVKPKSYIHSETYITETSSNNNIIPRIDFSFNYYFEYWKSYTDKVKASNAPW